MSNVNFLLVTLKILNLLGKCRKNPNGIKAVLRDVTIISEILLMLSYRDYIIGIGSSSSNACRCIAALRFGGSESSFIVCYLHLTQTTLITVAQAARNGDISFLSAVAAYHNKKRVSLSLRDHQNTKSWQCARKGYNRLVHV